MDIHRIRNSTLEYNILLNTHATYTKIGHKDSLIEISKNRYYTDHVFWSQHNYKLIRKK